MSAWKETALFRAHHDFPWASLSDLSRDGAIPALYWAWPARQFGDGSGLFCRGPRNFGMLAISRKPLWLSESLFSSKLVPGSTENAPFSLSTALPRSRLASFPNSETRGQSFIFQKTSHHFFSGPWNVDSRRTESSLFPSLGDFSVPGSNTRNWKRFPTGFRPTGPAFFFFFSFPLLIVRIYRAFFEFRTESA